MEALITDLSDSLQVVTKYRIAVSLYRTDPDRSLKDALTAYQKATEQNLITVRAQVVNLLGKLYKNKGEYKRAIRYQLEGDSLAEVLQDSRGLASVNNDLGILFKEMGQYEDALKHYKKANIYCREIKFGRGTSLTYSNIGTIYLEEKKFDEALPYLELALKTAREIDDLPSTANALGNLATYYNITDDDKTKALAYFKEAVTADSLMGDQLNMALAYTNMSYAYALSKDYVKATTYINEAIAICEELNARQMIIKAYNIASKVHAMQGDYKQAYERYVKLKTLQDSLLNDQSQQAVSDIKIKYETEKTERENELLNRELEIKKLETARQKAVNQAQLLGLGGLLLLGIVAGGFVYNQTRLKHKARMQEAINEQQRIQFRAVIAGEEKERRRVAHELHDGLGQMLSAAKLNVSALDLDDQPEEAPIWQNAMAIIDEACQEVRHISHNMMPAALMRLGLLPALDEMVRKLNEAGQINVSLQSRELKNIEIDESTGVNIYRMVQEVVNNTLKHSQANLIVISLTKPTDDTINIKIEDDGQGFDVATISQSKGIGWKNIYSRADMMGGQVEIDSQLGKGTVVQIKGINLSYALV